MLIKAFRLFVSSTFADLAQEREVLQSKVFPALNAYCAAKGYQFHAVDLRWGVNEEAQLDQRTAEICLGEVLVAKRYPLPNFLILVADRYGWVPLPFAIPEGEFEAATAWLTERGRARDVGDLRKVYRLDENYLLPPGLAAAAGSSEPIGAYTLRSREDEDIREYTPLKAWQELEDRLRGALQEAAHHLLQEERIGESACAKYFLSLTEQEIIRGLPSYNPSARNGAQGATGQADNEGPQAIAWIREPAAQSLLRRMLGVGSRPPTEVTSAVERVKTRIRQALPADSVLSGHLEDFAAHIESRLRAAIDSHIARFEAEEHSELVQERAQHKDFAEERRRIFVGRESNRAAIESYLAGGSPHPLVLFGPSGLGKSALVARAVAEAEESGRGMPVVYRFVGASTASADARSLLVSIVEDLAARGIVAKPEQWEEDDNKFDDQVRMLLTSIDKSAVVFIDALDQLKVPHQLSEGEKRYRLGWLPDKLPPRLKIVVSVLNDDSYKEDSSAYRALQQRLPVEAFLKIEPLIEHGLVMLKALETSVQRRLRSRQRDYLLAQFKQAGASPLYLKVAFEIARSWRSWDVAGQDRCVLAEDTAALIGQLIDELTSAHHHNRGLVSRTLGLIAAAKDGLSAKEITEVLSSPDVGVIQAITNAAEKRGVRTPLVERYGKLVPKLPDSVWVRLHRQLAPLLTEKRVDEQPLLQFFHRQLADIAHERHYAPARAALHSALADYFDTALETASKDAAASGRRIYARRSLSELPYQLFHADRRARLDQILMAPDWMQQKLAAHGVRTLIDDYQYAHTKAQILAGQALELAAGVLARDQRQLVPQILGRLRPDLADEPAGVAAIDELLRVARDLVRPPFLAPHWASFTAPGGPEMRRLEAHSGPINALAFSPDGRHVVSGSGDCTLRLWEVRSGASRALEEHGDSVRAVAFSPDGRYVVSGSNDRTLRLWNVASGASRVLEGHSAAVTAVGFSPDGRHAVSGSSDRTLRLWDVASGASRALESQGGDATLAFSPDGRHIVSGSSFGDGTLRLLDVASGASRPLGPAGAMSAVAFSPNGRHVVSGSYLSDALRLWDVAKGTSRALKGHGGWVKAVAFSPGGRQIAYGTYRHTLCLLEVANGASRVLGRHGDVVSAVTFSPDGRYVVSGSWDRTVRLWDIGRGGPRAPGGHGGEVMVVAFSPDGRHVVSGSVDGAVRLWGVESGISRRLEGQVRNMSVVASSPDGRHVVFGTYDDTLCLWDVERGASRTLEGHGNYVTAVALDGRHVVSGDVNGELRLWEVEGEASRVLEGRGGSVTAVAFSRDGRQVVSASVQDPLRLWEVASGASRAVEGHGLVRALAFSPDGRYVVSGSADGTLRLWDVTSGASRALEGHRNEVTAVAFSPDSQYVASACVDGTARLWGVENGTSRALDGHGRRVNAVAFSTDGLHVVSACDDCTQRLWQIASGREVARFDGDHQFLALQLSPNSKSLAAGDSGGRVHIIDILVNDADKFAWLALHRR